MAAVAEHIMSGRGNPDGIHWNFEAHKAVAELMLKALAEAGVATMQSAQRDDEEPRDQTGVATMQSAQRDDEEPRDQTGVATMQSAQRDDEEPRDQTGWANEKPRAEPMSVVVVTDSSSRLPDDMRQQWGIRQVPLHILIDDRDLRDGVDRIPDNIHECGGATTAAATPAELRDAYQQALAASGGDGVVAVHLSAALSGTLRAAETTAAELGPSIRVIDSKSTAMNTGFVALAAAGQRLMAPT
ncbi:hypothetical protein I552_9485 [Mycobacterium xenopi 3993]|nr:hypothetical protein I552_9485 [Mycobacterium xenopi 3993]